MPCYPGCARHGSPRVSFPVDSLQPLANEAFCCRSASISSRLRPLVSVTKALTNTKARTPITAYPKNTGPGPKLASRLGNVCETMKFAIQCKNIATPVAVPLILKGNTSGSMTQTVGPQVAAKEMIKPARHKSVMTATASVGLDGSDSTSVES